MIFKCKNCGGNSIYSPEKKSMFCPFCDSVDSEERQDFTEEDLKVCPNCGGEVAVTEHTSATKCPYCDNYLILNPRVEGAFEPKMIIPFQLGKDQCKELLREKFKKCIFAPIDFLSEAKLNGIEGDYVPFWFYDYNTRCEYQGEGTKIRSWRSGNYQYTETSFYHVVRDMDISFEKLPVDASVKMPDDVMDLLEPFSYEQLEAFKPEYISGFMAEKYNMTSELVESRAKERMLADAKELLRGTISGYATVRPMHENVTESSRNANFGLMPVWKYLYTYKDREYPFYVNGQTGKIVGTAPVSKGKVWAYAGTLWACLSFILAMLNLILIFV